MGLTLPIAMLAGLVSFASPCFLPVVPVFVGQLLGGGRIDRRTALVNSIAFVAGFSLVFIALWASLGLLGRSLGPYAVHARILGGAVLVFMGLHVAGLLSIPILNRLFRSPMPSAHGAATAWRAGLMGVVFAAGWTPCIGPVLSGILALASFSSTVWSGVVLMAAYCLGLGLPVVAVALGSAKVTQHFDWFQRHHVGISLVSGGLLVVVGFLMITNLFAKLANLVPGLGI